MVNSDTTENMNINREKKVDVTLIAAIISVAILIAAAVPLMLLGRYNHALGDDFYYGWQTKQALENGGIFDAFKVAAQETAHQYNRWQGTFSAMFLMQLPPQIFGDFFYKLYPTVLIGSLIAGVFVMMHPITVKVFKATWKEWIVISSVIAFMFIEMVPSMGEAFYWYNGSMYYTGFFALTLVFFGVLINFLTDAKIPQAVVAAVLGFLIAGANYASLMPMVIILFLLIMGLIIFKGGRKRIIGVSAVFVATMVAFAISVLAPGNALRQDTSYGTTPVKAILKSLYQAYQYIVGWNNVWMYVGLLLLTPLFIIMIKRVKYDFKLPLLFVVVGFGLLASASCPTFYAQNNGGAARVFDLSWYMVVLYVYASWFYVLGWAVKYIKVKDKYFYIGGCAALVVLYGILCALIIPNKPGGYLNSVNMTKAIASGDAAYYEAQYQARVAIIESDEQDMVFRELDVPASLVYVLWLGDLSTDATQENNICYAKFYGKNSVCIYDPGSVDVDGN